MASSALSNLPARVGVLGAGDDCHYILNDTDLWCDEGHIVYECRRCKKQPVPWSGFAAATTRRQSIAVRLDEPSD